MKNGRNDITVETLANGVRRTTIVKNGKTMKVDVMPDGKRRITRPDGRTHSLPPLQPSIVIIPRAN
jgi:hypothetical protein